MPKASIAALAAAALFVVPTLATPASATTTHDGTWSVSLVTKSGACDPSITSRIEIRDGRINENMIVARIVGAVSANGAVSLEVVRGADSLTARGKVRGASAAGSWTAPSQNCSGAWTAVKA